MEPEQVIARPRVYQIFKEWRQIGKVNFPRTHIDEGEGWVVLFGFGELGGDLECWARMTELVCWRVCKYTSRMVDVKKFERLLDFHLYVL